MKYFIDTEFIEGFHEPLFGKNRHFIDLISIGIVCEDRREYYAISKDFDLKSAWNSFQMEQASGDARNLYPEGIKKYWLRENVLKSVFEDLHNRFVHEEYYKGSVNMPFSYDSLKYLLSVYGKSNKQIAKEIIQFVCTIEVASDYAGVGSLQSGLEGFLRMNPPEFYGYYADYDWVLFCSLFGRMIDLPNGFPMYCKDLKQMLDEKAAQKIMEVEYKCLGETRLETSLKMIKNNSGYPKQENEHNALADAKWNKKLYEFLQSV